MISIGDLLEAKLLYSGTEARNVNLVEVAVFSVMFNYYGTCTVCHHESVVKSHWAVLSCILNC